MATEFELLNYSITENIFKFLQIVPEHLAQVSQNLNVLLANQDEIFKKQCIQTIFQIFDLISQEMAKIIANLIDDKIPEIRYKQQFLCRFFPGLELEQPENAYLVSKSKEITDLFQELKTLFEKIFLSLESILRELKALYNEVVTEDFNFKDHIENYLKITWSQLNILMSNSLVVLNQPKPIQRLHSNVNTSVCLLLGQVLDLESNPGLKSKMVSVLNENQLNQYLQYKSNNNESNSPEMIENSGSIKRNQKEFVQNDEGLLVAQFNELKILTIERLNRERRCRVTVEKYFLLYHTVININILEKQLSFPLWSISLPIAVNVNSCQNRMTIPSIIWDYAFMEKGQFTLESLHIGPFFQLFFMLSKCFEFATGAGLKLEHFEYLLSKFSKKIVNNGIQMVTYEEFCKKNLPDHAFTFFESFYSYLMITSKYLKVPWCKGSILGFYAKDQTETIIQNCPVGRFIVRFSESKLGGITFTFKQSDLTVTSCTPYTSDELRSLDFCEEINQISKLTHVFPNVPKFEAFPVN